MEVDERYRNRLAGMDQGQYQADCDGVRLHVTGRYGGQQRDARW